MIQDLLQAGLSRLGIPSTEKLVQSYRRYVELLLKWNQSYNLTAEKTAEGLIQRHVLDSLSVLPFLNGTQCLDIGTGAGLPGMILAITEPEREWTLLDSSQKKLRFLQHVKSDLKLENVSTMHSRIEEFEPDQDFDTMICRAYAPMERIFAQTSHLLSTGNQLLAMKGRHVKEEMQTLDLQDYAIQIHALNAFMDEEVSVLVQIKRK